MLLTTSLSYEYDIWERNDDNLSIIYQYIFKKKDEGWKVTRTGNGYQEKDKNKTKTGQIRARDWKEREKSEKRPKLKAYNRPD
ncbi:hypothetical protein Tco_1393431 [Tanacetum coccineum]